MSGILRLESLTKGNTLKQGDKTPLKYKLFDADGEQIDIAGKSAKVRLVYPDFLTIGYEKDGLTVAQDDTVTFTIDSIIPSRIYHVEIIVDDQFIFPSRADEAKFTVDKSSLGVETNIIEIVGVEAVVNTVLGRVDADISQAVTDINATNEAIQQAEQERAQGYQEIQQIIEDGTLNAEPKDKSITTRKLADEAVGYAQTNFIDYEVVSSNYFNKEDAILDTFLTDDGHVPMATYFVSGMFQPPEASSWTVYPCRYIRVFNADGSRNYFENTGDNTAVRTFEVPAGGWFEFAGPMTELNSAQVNKGTELEPFEEYKDPIVSFPELTFTDIQKNELLAQIDDDTPENAVPEDGSVTTEKLADKAITPDKTNFIYVDPRNLVDPETFTEGIYFSTSGAEVTSDLYTSTDFIPVTQGSYTLATPDISDNISKVARVPFYDKDKNFVSIVSSGISSSSNLTTANIPSDGYIRVSVRNEYAHNLVVAKDDSYDGYHDYMYRTDVRSQPPIASVGRDELIDRSVSVDKTNFITSGKNLFDKTEVDLNSFYSQAPLTTPLANYFTVKEPIELEANTIYTISHVRQWYLMSHDGSVISSNNTSNNNATVTFTTTDSCLLYMSGAMSNLDVTQIEVGDKMTEYEPYTFYFPSLSLTDEQKGGQGDPTTPSPVVEKDISVTKSNESFTLSSDLDGKPIVINTERYSSRDSNVFNFVSTQIDGVTVHSNNDDVTPIRTFTTVGANHGYTTIAIVNGTHDKTSSDLGSQWTDGIETFTLLLVEPNKLTFGNYYTTDSKGVTSSIRKLPESNLTHVLGATNATDINTSDSVTGQLYPSIGNLEVSYELDGNEITNDATYEGNVLQVKERYKILDYGAIVDFAQNNIGTSYADNVDTIDGITEMTNAYTFRKGLKCTTNHSLRALNNVRLGRCGFLQSGSLNASGYDRTRYMMGVNEKEGVDFNKGVDLTTYNTSLVLTHADSKDGTLPPNHYVDWLSNENGRFAGFTMGYIPDKTDSSNEDRVSNSPNTWDMRSSAKSYPIAVEGVDLEPGDYMSFTGFRNYVVPEEVGEAILYTEVVDGDVVYSISDFSEKNKLTGNDTVPIGKDIKEVQAQGTKSNESADMNGLVINSTQTDSTGVYKRNR